MKSIFSLFILSLLFAGTTFAQDGNRIPAKGFAVSSANGNFYPYEFTRHAMGDDDVQIEILYAGICHSDLHMVENKNSSVPLVPGHEIAGRVVAVGKEQKPFI